MDYLVIYSFREWGFTDMEWAPVFIIPKEKGPVFLLGLSVSHNCQRRLLETDTQVVTDERHDSDHVWDAKEEDH